MLEVVKDSARIWKEFKERVLLPWRSTREIVAVAVMANVKRDGSNRLILSALLWTRYERKVRQRRNNM